jgi:hypothetical protein
MLPVADADAHLSSLDEEAEDEVDFVGGCHEKLTLMLSLSKHEEWRGRAL